jgi:carboxypeptidase Q
MPASATRPKGTLMERPEYQKLSVYFNLDNGTGKIRGIFAQHNAAAVPLFRSWLKPFADLDAKTVTLQDTSSTDHIPFDQIGLPGFQFIQDPIEYMSRTHHSNMDVFDRIQPEDAKQAATIMAAFLWDAANMQGRFPRKPYPTP